MTEPVLAPAEQLEVPAASKELAGKLTAAEEELHRKLLGEKKSLQAKLDELLSKEKAREEAAAKKRGDFEAILKVREEELESERKKRLDLESTLTTGHKLNAVIEALGGNVDQKWLRLIDVDAVAINPTTGEVDKLTVAKVAENLKREWPEMTKAQGRLPIEAPKGLHGGAGKIARSEWLNLPAKEMLKWKLDQIVD